MSSEQTPLLAGSSSKTNPEPIAPSKLLAKEDSLTRFRVAIGINVDQTGDLEASRHHKGPQGLYKEVITIRRNRYIQFVAVEVLYYGAIIIQILIGALLASLGSLPSLHPAAITTLGIVNTFTGGILALLKGQGLPDRLRKDEYQMEKVQDFIEEMEIRLAIQGADSTLTSDELDKMVEQIFDKYNTARDTAEMNRPTSYVHQIELGSGGTQGLDGTGDADGPAGGLRSLIKKPDQNGSGGTGKGKLAID